MTAITGAEIVVIYKAIRDASCLMLEAAKKSQWDELEEMEAKRSSLIEMLVNDDVGDLKDSYLNHEKAELINQILKCDAETKSMTETWMIELQQILHSMGMEKKLSSAYTDSDE